MKRRYTEKYLNYLNRKAEDMNEEFKAEGSSDRAVVLFRGGIPEVVIFRKIN